MPYPVIPPWATKIQRHARSRGRAAGRSGQFVQVFEFKSFVTVLLWRRVFYLSSVPATRGFSCALGCHEKKKRSEIKNGVYGVFLLPLTSPTLVPLQRQSTSVSCCAPRTVLFVNIRLI